MKTVQTFLHFFPCVCLVLIVVACGSSASLQGSVAHPALVPAAPTAANDQSGIGILSYWYGADLDALRALEQVYQKQNPNVRIDDSFAGNNGGGTGEYLLERLRKQEPPDLFVVHAGKESLDYIERGQLEPITKIFKQAGFENVIPPLLIEQITIKGEIYTLPVNIHRSNLLWYNPKVFRDNNLKPPRTLDEFFAVAEILKAKGITPLATGGGFELGHLFESVLLAAYGPEDYVRLVHGDAAMWADTRLLTSIHTFKRMLDYANADRSTQNWPSVEQTILDGKAGMGIMGDWTNGQMKGQGARPGADYGWVPSPGTDGVFMWLSDSFGLAKGGSHRDAAIQFLKTAGSRDGQDAFNLIKGSIPTRIDADASLYDQYSQWSIEQFRTNKLVPSIMHGAAASDAFRSEFARAAIDFSNDGDEQKFAEVLRNAVVGLEP